MPWIMLLILVAFFALTFMSFYAMVNDPEMGGVLDEYYLQFPDAFKLIFSTAQDIGIILLIVLAASMVGNEYGWGTVRYTLSRSGKRLEYLEAKIGALLVVTVFTVLVCLVIGILLATFTTGQLVGEVSLDFLSVAFIGEFVRMFIWTVFTIMVYVLLAVLFAVLGRSGLWGIAGALGYHIMESIIVGLFYGADILSKVPEYLIGGNTGVLVFVDTGPFSSGDISLPSVLHATVTLCIYSLVFILISFYLFQRRDLTA